jgi:hypothetical protein
VFGVITQKYHFLRSALFRPFVFRLDSEEVKQKEFAIESESIRRFVDRSIDRSRTSNQIEFCASTLFGQPKSFGVCVTIFCSVQAASEPSRSDPAEKVRNNSCSTLSFSLSLSLSLVRPG